MRLGPIGITGWDLITIGAISDQGSIVVFPWGPARQWHAIGIDPYLVETVGGRLVTLVWLPT
jgi:hypothetical protein